MRNIITPALHTVIPNKHNKYRPYFLRHPILFFAGGLIILVKIITIFLFALVPETAYLSTISTPFLVDQVNRSRQEAGLPALSPNSLLQNAARLKGEDMLKHDYFAHNSPSGITPWKWFDDAGYNYIYAGENLAIDFTTGEGVHSAWMNSPGHRRNILNERYREIGIAVVSGEYEGRTTTIVVQHFGSLSPEIPQKNVPINESAKETEANKKSKSVIKPTPTPIPPPEITDPRQGQILPSGAATVRGTAINGSSVEIILDKKTAGSFPSPDGRFQGEINLPLETVKDVKLTAIANLQGKKSAPSKYIEVKIDTRGPAIAQDSAIYLPDPDGDISSALLIVPIFGAVASATASIEGMQFPLEIQGSIAKGNIASAATTSPLEIRAEDSLGRVRSATVNPLRKFNTYLPTKEEAAAYERFATINAKTKFIFSLLVYILVFLLAINILVHVRIQHADMIVHALFVIVMGTILFLIT